MKIEFDPITDALYVELSDSEVERSEEIRPGVILDCDAQGNVVGVEVLSARQDISAGENGRLSPG